ncbi:MAG: hypothetical protein RBU21_21070 [FCB group bacterium]|jgi:hypothetical protein|nr:hypothetical protein [FCB group bacterium]
MTTERATQIGIDRLVRLAWLEQTASLVLGGGTAADIKSSLQTDLCSAFRSARPAERGSLGKTITILMKVWKTTPPDLVELKEAGLDLLHRMPKSERMAVHWGMTMAVYPFWANVAAQVGRLLKLQGAVTASQVQRRMREQYGERETVSRRTRYALRSFVDWGVLRETDCKGTYEPLAGETIVNVDLAVWLIEAVLQSGVSGSTTLKGLIDSAALFPFRLPRLSHGDLAAFSQRLEVITHNLDEELVVLGDPISRKTSDV